MTSMTDEKPKLGGVFNWLPGWSRKRPADSLSVYQECLNVIELLRLRHGEARVSHDRSTSWFIVLA